MTMPNACCVVVGTGSIGMLHLRLLAKADYRPLAFPAREERANVLRSNGYVVVTDWRDVVDRGATHAIIATSTARHSHDAMHALNAGLEVLVEKPLAVDVASARAAVETARRRRRGLWIGCCLRFQPALQMFARELPALGRLHSVRVECQSFLPDWRPERAYAESYSARADEGGVLRDLIHEIDYAGWLFGWPEAVQARIRNLGRLGIASEEAADLLWETDSGAAISIRLDYLSRPRRRLMRAAGEYGVLEWDGVTGAVTVALAGAPEIRHVVGSSIDDMYVEQLRSFLEAAPGQCDPRMATAADGIRALAVCDAARLASENRREEPVRY